MNFEWNRNSINADKKIKKDPSKKKIKEKETKKKERNEREKKTKTKWRLTGTAWRPAPAGRPLGAPPNGNATRGVSRAGASGAVRPATPRPAPHRRR